MIGIRILDVRYIKQSRKPITTGWQRIDEITKGGIGAKELAVVIAPTGAGKSMVLVHLGAQVSQAWQESCSLYFGAC